MTIHAQDFTQVLKEQKVDLKLGLSEPEANERVAKFGPNTLPAEKKLTPLFIFLRQFRNPLIYILLIAAAVTFILREYTDMTVILIAVTLSTVLGFFQENKAQESILALQKLTLPRAKVLREGQVQAIEASAVVPGDILIFEEGDQITADARLIEVHELLVDESVLTGESTRVRKQTDPVSKETTLGDQKNMVFAGTLVVGGNGRSVVCATGLKTEMGKIAKVVIFSKEAQTPLQKNLSRLGIFLSLVVLVLSALVFVLGVLGGEPPALMFLFAVALAVSAIPEALIILVTISLAVAVTRMAKRKALARSLPAVEGLGAVTVIAADKTGTLTQNKLTVQKVFLDGEIYEPEHPFETPTFSTFVQIAVLCNNASLDLGDPLEQALLEFVKEHGFEIHELQNQHPREMEMPFSSFTRLMVTLNLGFLKKGRLLVKGAPKEILKATDFELMEGKIIRLSENVRNHILHQARQMANQGLKPLALAFKEIREREEAKVLDLIFVGLLGLADSLRLEAGASVKKIQQAGVRVLMLTGDHRLTAGAIAREAGIVNPDQVIKGEELEKLSKKELKKLLQETNVFARMTPEHKLTLIEILQEQGEVVAMTGDGVNDAPALTRADIGVAMGLGGTDVARSASDLVLQDNNFATIVAAIEEGRAIFDNLKKVIVYLISTNFGEILVVLGGFLLRLPLPLYPTQILWLNLVTDGLPVNALVFEPKERDVLARPPRDSKAFIFNKTDFFRILLFGLVMAAGSLFLFMKFLPQGTQKARTVTLAVMALFQIFNAFNLQSSRDSLFKIGIFRNWYLFGAVLISLIFQFLVVEIDFLMNLFRTVPLTFNEWFLIILVSLTVVLVEEIRKSLIKIRA